jgi:amidophosphoribosyltransferase
MHPVLTVTGDVTSDDIVRLNEGRMQQSEDDADSSRLALPNAEA